jgi:hypothetical protein
VAKARSTGWLTLFGTVGFGIGGAIGGAVWFAFDAPHLGFAILGAFGGSSLCLTRKDWRTAIVIVLACAIGFDIGFLIPFFLALVIWVPAYGEGIFVGGIGGIIGGIALGLGKKEWKKTWLLALAGAIGFGIGVQATWDTLRGLEPQILWGAIKIAIWGIFGGASLGAASGYLENRWSDHRENASK